MIAPAPAAVPATTTATGRPARLFWLLHTAGWLGVFLVSYLTALAHGDHPGSWRISFVLAAVGFVATLGLRRLLRRWGTLPVARLIAMMAVPVLLAGCAMALAYTLALVVWCGDNRPSDALGYLAYTATTLYMVMSWVGLYIGVKVHQRLRQQTEAALAASVAAHRAQLTLLRYQLHPHFLFNTLNSISTLILERDSATANRMVVDLSRLLRRSLDGDPAQRIRLDDELATIDLYLGIEAERFGDRLIVARDIDPACRAALVPGLVLQPLVENAIKHAIARNIAGGTLRLAARRDGGHLVLTVADDGPGFDAATEAPPPGAGVGLSNTRDRLRVLYGAGHSVELRDRPEGGCEVQIRLPFDAAPSDEADA